MGKKFPACLALGCVLFVLCGCASMDAPIRQALVDSLSDDEATEIAAERVILNNRRASIRFVRKALRAYDVDAMNDAIPVVFVLGEDAEPLVPDLIRVLRHGGQGFLLGSCEFPDFSLRYNASAALAAVGESAVPALQRFLAEEGTVGSIGYPKAVVGAIEALGSIGDSAQQAVSQLEELAAWTADSPEAAEIRTAAEAALMRIRGPAGES